MKSIIAFAAAMLVASPVYAAEPAAPSPATATEHAVGPVNTDEPTRRALVLATLQRQCAYLHDENYDGYKNTLTPDFRRMGPITQDEGRDEVVKRARRGAGPGALKTVSCDVEIVRTMPTPTGPFAEYIETDHMEMSGTKMDIVVRATADFVPGPDATLLQQSMHRSGFKFVVGGKIIHQEGSLD